MFACRYGISLPVFNLISSERVRYQVEHLKIYSMHIYSRPCIILYLFHLYFSNKTSSAIDPFNESNMYSFPLLTSLKLYSFNRITKAEYDVNSGKLYILNLLKGSIAPLSMLGVQSISASSSL